MHKRDFSIHWVPIKGFDKNVMGMASCPGKTSMSEGSNNKLENDLQSIWTQGIRCLVTLIPDYEIRLLRIDKFHESVSSNKFVHLIEEISDFSTPEPKRLEHFASLILKIKLQINKKKPVLIHCNSGLGRSGIVAAIVLKSFLNLRDPISYLRSFVPKAIETENQESFVTNW